MNQENTFSYEYSAKENKEIQEIRKKYLPQSESKLEDDIYCNRGVWNTSKKGAG